MKLKQGLITRKKELPEGWRILPYEKCVAKLKLNKVKKYKVTEYLKEGKYPIIDQSKELINGYTNIENDVMYFETPIIIFGDHTLNVKYVDFPFARGAEGTQIITPNINIVVPKYFYYHLLSLNIKVKLYERYFKYVKQSFFIIPPLPIQQKIVSKLDRQMAQIEMMKKEAEREKGTSEEMQRSFLNEIFKFGEEKLPEGWKFVRLGNILEMNYGKGLANAERKKGEIPVYGSNGVIGFNNDCLIGFNTIIIGRKGSAGELNFVERPCWPIDTTYYVTTRYNLKFIYYLLKHINLKKITQKGAKPGLNREEAYDLIAIFTEDETEQKKIVSKLDKQIEEIKTINKNINSKLNAISQLPSSLLNQVFGQYKIPEEV